MPSILDQLGLTKAKGTILIAVDSGIEDSGMANEFLGMFVIGIKTGQTIKDMATALCHEMVHVKQLKRKQLTITKRGFVWKGRVYKREMNYLAMPWEIEAFSKQEIIFRRAFDSI